MTILRSRLVDTDVTPRYHCISRCVRPALRLSEDGLPGRKDWIDLRLKEHDRIFAISVGGFSIMENHLPFLAPNRCRASIAMVTNGSRAALGGSLTTASC